MESPNLNSPFPENDELDAQGRAQFSMPPLADDGFSDRVLAALPIARNRTIQRRRGWFCAAGLIAGVMVTAIGLIDSNNYSPILPQLVNGAATAAVQFFSGPVMLALGLTAFSLWFAFRDRLRLLPRL